MGMEARNRRLPDWFTRIRTGQLKLPRFQRFESWSHAEVVTLLDSVIRGRPVGAALVLEIGDKEPFVSRPIAGAPEPTERTTEHLLDGQQRLTALWKALKDHYEDRTYFALLKSKDESLAISFGRWMNNGRRYPIWADQSEQQYKRGYVPMRLLDPEIESDEIEKWCDEATSSIEDSRITERQVGRLRKALDGANLPFLALPVGTSPDDAIDVFIKMNTTSVQLTAFDIIVAQLEGETGRSLHDLEESLRAAVPTAERYLPISGLVLQVAALREGWSPTTASFRRLDVRRLSDEWEAIERGIDGATRFLSEERIFDRHRLPTVAVLPVLASIWSQMPQELDAHGQARTLLRQYLWRSFFTSRYERAAGTAALQDHRGLKARLVDRDETASIPILDDTEFPIASEQELKKAPWPRRLNTLARGILAVSLRGGGLDLADGTPASYESLSKREYHHLFPASLLRNETDLEESDINLALNCALITWNTNRNISAKEPVAYLRERAEHAILGVDQIQHRLNSHTIPFKELNVGGYSEITEPKAKSAKIRSDYERFIAARAKAIYDAVKKLCNGEEWTGLDGVGQ